MRALNPRPSLLVVENDQAVREAVAMAVSHLGYEVVLVESGTGEEALQIIASAPSLDGLYTDIELAGSVTGWTVGQTFGIIWPKKPVVYASGAARAPERPPASGLFLRKPFDLGALECAFNPAALRDRSA
jgi:CheY-like chemotaxis protein